MTDEIDRLEALLREAFPGRVWVEPDHPDVDTFEVLCETAPDTVDLIADGASAGRATAIAALGSVWPELLAVVRVLDETSAHIRTEPALRALRARIREVLGEADADEPEPVRCEDCDCPNDPRRWACDRCGAGLPEEADRG